MNETRQILDDYVKQGSDSAFRELVSRYIDLVYSVALRRVSGDAHRAEDITQKVFADLARKAHSLPRNVMLGGWLHRHCCFVANTSNRTESRRHAREREAIQMDALNSAPDSSWSEVAPALDSAIQELPEPDRDAIILRFFESQDLKKVGTMLGVSEDAAQKRVSRALEKLRGILLKQGVTLSIAGLTTALLTHATTAAPTSLAPEVARTSLQNAAATGGLLAGLAALLHTIPVKVALVALAAGLTYLAISHKTENGADTTHSASPSLLAKTGSGKSTESGFVKTVEKSAATADVTPQETFSGLRLQLIDAATSAPIGDALVEQRMWLGKKFVPQKYHSDKNGFCEVPLPEGITDLNLTTRADPYADTRLLWHPKEGDKIPNEYTVRLIHGVPIGGRVIDALNLPVSNASVSFSHRERSGSENAIETHEFAWMEVKTDKEGIWRINRIAEEILNESSGRATHPEHVKSPSIVVAQDSPALEQLKQLNYTFQLGSAVTVTGHVLDDAGNPVPDAIVLVGLKSTVDARQAQVALDGSFEVKGCLPGKSLITAEAPRYAPTTFQVDLTSSTGPMNIILKAGKVLKILVVNKQEEPLVGAQLWLNTLDSGRGPLGNKTPFIQTEYAPKTDHNGRVFWDQAPDRELEFDVESEGYMRTFGWKVRPDGNEHKIVLANALKIQGTVVNAQDKSAIPRFKIFTGWPESEANPEPLWSSFDRFQFTFINGKFEHQFEEPPIIGVPDPAYIFKFEADGYSPFISRVIKADEGVVTLNVALTPQKAQSFTVLLPDGTPAAYADVAFGNEHQFITIDETGFSDMTAPFKRANEKGEVTFQPEPNLVNIVIYHAQGFAHTTPSEISKNKVVQLKAWGRIEGKLTNRGKPVAGHTVKLDPNGDPASPLRFFLNTRVTSDSSGNFTMEKLPPGKHHLMEELAAPNPRPGQAIISTRLGTVDIEPNQTTVFNHDENGSIVSVKLLWPENTLRRRDEQVFVAIATPFTPPPLEIRNNPETLKRWRELPQVQEMMSKMQSWLLFENPPGVWKSLTPIPPGNYAMGVTVTSKAVQAGSPMLHAESTVIIPESGAENLELGPIALNSTTKEAE